MCLMLILEILWWLAYYFLLYCPWIQVIVNTDELNQIVEATGVSYDQANQAYIVSKWVSAGTLFVLTRKDRF